jgi:uncharacterized protein (TIGR03437 family)
LFNGVASPLLYAQSNQVNAVVPFEIAGRDTAEVQIVHNMERTGTATVSVVAAQPGVFQGTVFNEDGTVNSASNPAAKGSVIRIFATGAGQTNPPSVTGTMAADDSIRPRLRVEALIGGIGAERVNASIARGAFPGILQVVARVPMSAPSGPDVLLELAVGEAVSPPTATVAIR